MSRWYPDEKKLTKRDVEFYAQALWDLMLSLGVEDGHCKEYDPLTIIGKIAHSYVFNLEDGGRRHPFNDLEELRELLLKETHENIMEWKNEQNGTNNL